MMNKLKYCILITAIPLVLAQPGPKTFATPGEARDGLIEAAANGMDSVKAFFGPGSAEIVRSGDEVQDKLALERFNRLAAEKTQWEPDSMNPDRMTLDIGVAQWPFAVPLVRKHGRWFFDLQEGKAEIRRRTIGRQELDAIQICRGYVEAQQAYAATDWEGKGVLQYASRIISSPAKKDGLYWPGGDSPVAEAFAKAVAQGYSLPSGQHPNGQQRPFHGYFFKMLTSQGPEAAGGAQDYVVRGLAIGGFALIAWPAEYGVSGIKTFIVNHTGVVYEKDFGPQTGSMAKAITRFNPDKSWDVVPEDDDQ